MKQYNVILLKMVIACDNIQLYVIRTTQLSKSSNISYRHLRILIYYVASYKL